MFDFAWSEIVVIGVVAMIAIGPKDMPAAIRTVSGMIKKARKMAGEFQTHVDEMVREADLGDVKKAFTDIRNLDIASVVERHVDPDRSIRGTFADNPFQPDVPSASETLPSAALDEVTVSEQPVLEPMPAPPAEPPIPLSPAFIPPNMVPPQVVEAKKPAVEPPAFIPPEVVRQRQSRA